MYLASNDFSTAEDLFRQVKEPNVQNYVAFMNHFNETTCWTKTLEFYDQMKTQRKIQADVSTFVAVLNAAKHLKNIEKVKEIQADLLKQNLWQNHGEIQKILKEIFDESKN